MTRRRGAEPRADIPQTNVQPGGLRRRARQGTIGQRRIRLVLERGFRAAIQEIEQDRTRHDRHVQITDWETPALFGKPPHHPVGGGQAEGRTTAQNDRVHSLQRGVRAQQFELTCPGAATLHIDCGDRAFVGQDHRHTGTDCRVLGSTDPQPGHVGDRVTCANLAHSIPRNRSSAATAMTLADATMSSMSIYSSG